MIVEWKNEVWAFRMTFLGWFFNGFPPIVIPECGFKGSGTILSGSREMIPTCSGHAKWAEVWQTQIWWRTPSCFVVRTSVVGFEVVSMERRDDKLCSSPFIQTTIRGVFYTQRRRQAHSSSRTSSKIKSDISSFELQEAVVSSINSNWVVSSLVESLPTVIRSASSIKFREFGLICPSRFSHVFTGIQRITLLLLDNNNNNNRPLGPVYVV